MNRHRADDLLELRAVPRAGRLRQPHDDRDDVGTPTEMLLAAWLAEVSADALRAGEGRVGSLPVDGGDAAPSELEPAG